MVARGPRTRGVAKRCPGTAGDAGAHSTQRARHGLEWSGIRAWARPAAPALQSPEAWGVGSCAHGCRGIEPADAIGRWPPMLRRRWASMPSGRAALQSRLRHPSSIRGTRPGRASPCSPRAHARHPAAPRACSANWPPPSRSLPRSVSPRPPRHWPRCSRSTGATPPASRPARWP